MWLFALCLFLFFFWAVLLIAFINPERTPQPHSHDGAMRHSPAVSARLHVCARPHGPRQSTWRGSRLLDRLRYWRTRLQIHRARPHLRSRWLEGAQRGTYMYVHTDVRQRTDVVIVVARACSLARCSTLQSTHHRACTHLKAFLCPCFVVDCFHSLTRSVSLCFSVSTSLSLMFLLQQGSMPLSAMLAVFDNVSTWSLLGADRWSRPGVSLGLSLRRLSSAPIRYVAGASTTCSGPCTYRQQVMAR